MIEQKDDWTPQYSRWRHGGWYVDNVVYPSGAVGCVSNNYDDKKWRIVCGDENQTFPSRDAAARAERLLAENDPLLIPLALPPALTPKQIKSYVQAGGVSCPYCNSDVIEGAFVDVGEGTAHQKMFCAECESSWRDIYTLTTVHTLED